MIDTTNNDPLASEPMGLIWPDAIYETHRSDSDGWGEASDKVDRGDDPVIVDEMLNKSISEDAMTGREDDKTDRQPQVSAKVPKESKRPADKESERSVARVKKSDAFDEIHYYAREILGGNFSRNLVTGCVQFGEKPIDDQLSNTLYISGRTAHSSGSGWSLSDWHTYLGSGLIPDYNPLIEWFVNNEKSARAGIIDELVSTLVLDPKQGMPFKVVYTLVLRWMVGLVAGIFGNNYNSLLLILSGPKGCGKTEWARRLLPDALMPYFAETKLDSAKDDVMKACENLLLLVDECDSLTRAEAAEIRRFLSQNIFTYRAPYARSVQKRKRYASLIGTSNSSELINDRRNNRRLIVLCILDVVKDAYNSIDKTTLWAEVYRLYKAGERWHLNGDEIAALDEYTGGNEVSTPEKDWLQRCFEPDPNEVSFYPAGYILAQLSGQSGLRLNHRTLTRSLKPVGS